MTQRFPTEAKRFDINLHRLSNCICDVSCASSSIIYLYLLPARSKTNEILSLSCNCSLTSSWLLESNILFSSRLPFFTSLSMASSILISLRFSRVRTALFNRLNSLARSFSNATNCDCQTSISSRDAFVLP